MFAVKYEFPPLNHKDPFNDTDLFIEMAQEALEQAELEEEQKGVLYELMEALLNRTGAPMIAGVIYEQLKSQDVIERLAEDHHDHPSSAIVPLSSSPNTLKEETSLDEEELEIGQQDNTSFNNISDYSWILFRLLLLASLVGLVYHFVCYHFYF